MNSITQHNHVNEEHLCEICEAFQSLICDFLKTSQILQSSSCSNNLISNTTRWFVAGMRGFTCGGKDGWVWGEGLTRQLGGRGGVRDGGVGGVRGGRLRSRSLPDNQSWLKYRIDVHE